MDLQALADLALRLAGQGGQGPGHRPLGRRRGLRPVGHGPGLRGGPRLRDRRRPGLLKMFQNQKRAKGARAKAFAQQAEHSNRSGRHRTMDYQLPKSLERRRDKVHGRGMWKRWTPDAVLRAAFSKENAAVRDVAAGVDGASPGHASNCKVLVAELVMRAQKDGLAQFQEQAAAAGTMPFALLNMIFDETELELKVPEFGPAAWSVLASHSQVSFRSGGQTHDFDVIRPPMAIPNKQACTMWPALCDKDGGLWPALSTVDARFRAVLTTCDAAAANVKLLSHLQRVLDPGTLLLPFLCLQHRTGNVMERVTKLLGVLTGCFAVAKTLASGQVMRRLTAHVRDILQERLQVLDSTPPGLVGDWASGHAWAKHMFDLVRQERQADVADRASASRKPDVYDEFLAFFGGPWTGLQGSGSLSP